jgi:hypothetical protein
MPDTGAYLGSKNAAKGLFRFSAPGGAIPGGGLSAAYEILLPLPLPPLS